VSVTLMICVHDFPLREVMVKVGVMEFGLKPTATAASIITPKPTFEFCILF